jgi:hypothetical protein
MLGHPTRRDQRNHHPRPFKHNRMDFVLGCCDGRNFTFRCNVSVVYLRLTLSGALLPPANFD